MKTRNAESSPPHTIKSSSRLSDVLAIYLKYTKKQHNEDKTHHMGSHSKQDSNDPRAAFQWLLLGQTLPKSITKPLGLP